MKHGDYRDGSSISFTPRARRSTTVGRAIGVLLLVAGLAGLALGVHTYQQSEPLRVTGASAIGVLIGYELVPGSGAAEHAMVQFNAGSTTYVAYSDGPVAAAAQQMWGTIHEVRYDRRNPDRSFIEGLDPLEAPVGLLGGAGAAVALGLILMALPPRLRTRS